MYDLNSLICIEIRIQILNQIHIHYRNRLRISSILFQQYREWPSFAILLSMEAVYCANNTASGHLYAILLSMEAVYCSNNTASGHLYAILLSMDRIIRFGQDL